jgi:diguanylate cyclase (GGDEF)-like protein
MPAEADLSRLRLGLVLEIGHAINAPAPLPNTLDAVCAAARAFGWERAAIVMWEATESGVKAWRASSGPEHDGGLGAEVAARGRDVLRLFEVREVTPLDDVLGVPGRAGVALLVRSAGEAYGVLAVEDPTLADAAGDAALTALRRLGDLAAVAARSARFADAPGASDLADPLTQLASRRAFEETLRREVERAYRGLLPLSVIVVDLDRLDRVNQAHGREAGDAAIRCVAHVLLEGLRQVDIAAHSGSGQFQILLPGASSDGAREVAERLRCAVAAANVPGIGAITATFGVAVLNEHAANAAGLLQAALAALDLGKRRGRNRVSLALSLGRRP